MLTGVFQHEDFAGHRGKIGPGDLQWMTAGKGIVHAEIPYSDGLLHGLQLWVNLPKKEKMCEPRYQELLDKDIPKVQPKEGVDIKVSCELLMLWLRRPHAYPGDCWRKFWSKKQCHDQNPDVLS